MPNIEIDKNKEEANEAISLSDKNVEVYRSGTSKLFATRSLKLNNIDVTKKPIIKKGTNLCGKSFEVKIQFFRRTPILLILKIIAKEKTKGNIINIRTDFRIRAISAE